MKKTVYIIWHDNWHPKDNIEPAVDAIFSGEEWNVVKTLRARDLMEPGVSPDLAIFYTNGRPEGETDLTNEEQKQIADKVAAGMGILFIHAGMTIIEPDSVFFNELNSGRFASHPPKCDVTMTPISGLDHPILQEVTPFTQYDEHYYCPMFPERPQPLMCASSEYSVTVGAWCHSHGKGRVVGITQGHTREMQTDPGMIRLVSNAAHWLTEGTEGEQ